MACLPVRLNQEASNLSKEDTHTMAAAKKKSAVVSFRAANTIALPASLLGYSDLVKPYQFSDDDKPVKRGNFHFDPKGIAALSEIITTKVYTEEAIAKLTEEAEENGFASAAGKGNAFALKPPQDPEEWLAAKLKEPKEKSPVNDRPFILIGNNAFRKDSKSGEMVEMFIKAWDAKNNLLPLDKLRLSAGSLVEAIVYPNLFISKLIGFPQPSLKLVGIRIQKLKQFTSGGAAPADTDDEAIKAALGADFEADDLSRFLKGDDAEGEDTPPNPEGMF